jgi:hypothetical protein
MPDLQLLPFSSHSPSAPHHDECAIHHEYPDECAIHQTTMIKIGDV